MIYITGDTHASFQELVRNNEAFCEQNAENGTIFVAENTAMGEKFRISGNKLFPYHSIRSVRVADRNLPLKTSLVDSTEELIQLLVQ